MARVFIGYTSWDTKLEKPMAGTRRCKVWTTEKEALAKVGGRGVVVPVYAEVPDGPTEATV